MKIVKFLISVVMIVLCISNLFTTLSFSDSIQEIEKLEKAKEDYESGQDKFYDGNCSFNPYYESVSISAYVFMYTDTAAKMNFQYFPEPYDFETEKWTAYENYGFLFTEYYPAEDDPRYNPTAWNPSVLACIYNEQIEEIFRNNPYLPKLYALVKALNIPKEELYLARERMENDPEFIRTVFPQMSEENYTCFTTGFEWNLRVRRLKDFMIEAMYLNDDYETMKLLAKPWVVIAEDRPLMLGWLMSDDTNLQRYQLTMDDLQKKKLRTKDFDAFIAYCRNWLEHPWETEMFHPIDKDFTALADYLNALEKIVQAAPPRAGARTGVYLGAAALSAALLAGGVSILRRRKRRLA